MFIYKSIVLLLAFSIPPAGAEIYKWTDAQGRVHYSDRAPEQAEQAEQAGQGLEEVSKDLHINSLKSTKITASDFLEARQTQREQQARKRNGKVVMYSTDWCGVCKKARNYFRQNKIRFTEYDVEKSARGREDFVKLKGKGVPILLVGKKRMDGFTESRFRQIYDS